MNSKVLFFFHSTYFNNYFLYRRAFSLVHSDRIWSTWSPACAKFVLKCWTSTSMSSLPKSIGRKIINSYIMNFKSDFIKNLKKRLQVRIDGNFLQKAKQNCSKWIAFMTEEKSQMYIPFSSSSLSGHDFLFTIPVAEMICSSISKRSDMLSTKSSHSLRCSSSKEFLSVLLLSSVKVTPW